MLVVPELEQELAVGEATRTTRNSYHAVAQVQHAPCHLSLFCSSLLAFCQVTRHWPHLKDHAFLCISVTQSLGWRTMLVVPELEQELAVGEATRTTQFELKMLRNARSDLDTQVCAVLAVAASIP
jgi:hypothetical protein